MCVRRIDDLIVAARGEIEDELDLWTIYEWKKQAVEYLTEHLGPDHYYTQYFTVYMRELEQKVLLTGAGVLAAAKEEIHKIRRASFKGERKDVPQQRSYGTNPFASPAD
jgi:hypothetical protein